MEAYSLRSGARRIDNITEDDTVARNTLFMVVYHMFKLRKPYS